MKNELRVIEVYGDGHYYVDANGNVYSDRGGYIKRMHGHLKKEGYVCVHITNNNKQRKVLLIHRLVAFAFIDNPNNYPYINHKNGIKTDNRTSNLEWVTSKMNSVHALNHGLLKFVYGSKNHNAKLTEEDVKVIRNRIKVEGYAKVYKDYGFVGWWTFRDVCRGKSWRHV